MRIHTTVGCQDGPFRRSLAERGMIKIDHRTIGCGQPKDKQPAESVHQSTLSAVLALNLVIPTTTSFLS
jgi:hypothetical protein